MIIALVLPALPIAAAPAPPVSQQSYIVGPNDVLLITVFNQPQLSGKFTVEADGTIAFPLLGRVSTAGGLTVRAVEEKIRDGLATRYLKDPQVSVAVDQYRSQQIFVAGEVRQPGSLQFTGSMTLIEALVRAGSTTDRAGADVVVVRSSSGSAAGRSSRSRRTAAARARSSSRCRRISSTGASTPRPRSSPSASSRSASSPPDRRSAPDFARMAGCRPPSRVACQGGWW